MTRIVYMVELYSRRGGYNWRVVLDIHLHNVFGDTDTLVVLKPHLTGALDHLEECAVLVAAAGRRIAATGQGGEVIGLHVELWRRFGLRLRRRRHRLTRRATAAAANIVAARRKALAGRSTAADHSAAPGVRHVFVVAAAAARAATATAPSAAATFSAFASTGIRHVNVTGSRGRILIRIILLRLGFRRRRRLGRRVMRARAGLVLTRLVLLLLVLGCVGMRHTVGGWKGRWTTATGGSDRDLLWDRASAVLFVALAGVRVLAARLPAVVGPTVVVVAAAAARLEAAAVIVAVAAVVVREGRLWAVVIIVVIVVIVVAVVGAIVVVATAAAAAASTTAPPVLVIIVAAAVGRLEAAGASRKEPGGGRRVRQHANVKVRPGGVGRAAGPGRSGLEQPGALGKVGLDAGLTGLGGLQEDVVGVRRQVLARGRLGAGSRQAEKNKISVKEKGISNV